MNAHRISSILLAAVLAAGVSPPAGAVDPPPAWELWPYRVRVLWATDDAHPLPPRLQNELPDFLQARLGAAVGGAWKLEVTAAPAELQHAVVHDLAAVAQESLTAAADDVDKIILLGIGELDGAWQVHARELDLATRLWNATITVECRQVDFLPHAAVRAVWEAFAPLARIDGVEGEVATLRLRGSGLLPGGKSLLRQGMVFRPVLLPSSANGALTPGKAEPIEWTFLTKAESQGSTIQCRIQTALAGAAIPDYHPLRQRWALGVGPTTDSTRLRLVSRENSGEPLEGIDVLAEGDPPVAIGQSDRHGEVTLPPGPEGVRTIVIKLGDDVLARLPLLPGLVDELTLPLDFDRRLVELEPLLVRLADDVLDAAVRRAVLAARAAAAEKIDAEAAARLRQQAAAAGTADSFLARLDKLQQSVQSAGAATRRRLEPKLAEVRKGIDQLKSPPAAK